MQTAQRRNRSRRQLFMLFLAPCLLFLEVRGQQPLFAHSPRQSQPIKNALLRRVRFADLNGDGWPDLIGTSSDFKPPLRLNDQLGGFSPFLPFPLLALNPLLSVRIAQVATGDVDKDGDLDILLLFYSGGANRQNRLVLNDGKGAFREVTATALPPELTDSSYGVFGDLNGDGYLDLVVGNFLFGALYGGTPNYVYFNDGKGKFTKVSNALSSVAESTSSLALFDADNDRDLDLLVVNLGTRITPHPNRLYLNNGKGYFKEAPLDKVALFASQESAIGDIDGDGDLDVLVSNYDSIGSPLALSLYINDRSKNRFVDGSSRLPSLPPSAVDVELRDIDNDGDLDILVAVFYWTKQGPPLRILRNDGSGRFSDVTASELPNQPTNPVLGFSATDLDLDGDVDIVASRFRFFDAVAIFINRYRQVDAPSPAKIGSNYILKLHGRSGHGLILALSTGHVVAPWPGLGVLGLDPNTLITLPTEKIGASGEKSLQFAIPNNPSLRGLKFFAQGLDVGPGNGLGPWLTNTLGETIQ